MMNRPDKLNCPDVELLLAEFAAQELQASQAEAVSRHLDRCPACRAELAREQELSLVVESLPLVPWPDRVARTQSGANLDIPVKRRILRTLWPAAAPLAAAAVLVLVLLPGNGSDLIIDSDGHAWQRTELESARADLKWTLNLTANAIDRTERNAMAEVFGRKLPQTLTGSLRNVLTNVQGGQG